MKIEQIKKWDNNRSKENLDWELLQQKSILFDRIRIVSKTDMLRKLFTSVRWRERLLNMEYFHRYCVSHHN